MAKIKPKMKRYTIIQRAVEEGIAAGYRRAHKHIENPTEEHLKQELEKGVMDALSEIIDYGDGYG